ncbi:hypothetical protein ABNF65_21255 [Paenibacillus larvae]
MNFINLTPHAVHIMPLGPEGPVRTIPSSGEVRVATEREDVAYLSGIPINRTYFGKVEGLPKKQKGTMYIVSSITAQAAPDRRDLLVPDDPVRDEEGRVIGCRALAFIGGGNAE